MRTLLVFLLGIVTLTGCLADRVDSQTRALSLSSDSLEVRQMQSRRFDTQDERLIINAVTGVLQDMGYALGEISSASGLVSAARGNMRVSVVVKPVSRVVTVRAAFQDMTGRRVTDPLFYQKFFDKLAQSVFLEAHQI